jgi:hypothetical protein
VNTKILFFSFQDAVVQKNGKLLADKSNDYELLEGARNDSDFLSVTVQRRWSTCDQLEDMPMGVRIYDI